MGRLRKTTAELERKGAFDKNPKRGRERAAEPVPADPIGLPPKGFTDPHSPTAVALLAIWNELLANAKEVQLTSGDRIHVETTCRLIYRCRSYGAKTGDFAQLNKYLAQLGLNPSDRSRVQGIGHKTTEEEADEWNDLAEQESRVRVQ